MSPFSRNLPQRRPTRLRGLYYSGSGAYFVTIPTQNRICSLGDVVDGSVQLGPAGQIVQDVWGTIAVRFRDVATDAFIIMPNHIHGIIIVGAQFIAPEAPREANGLRPGETSENDGRPAGAMNRAPTWNATRPYQADRAPRLGECVRTLKAASARLIHIGPMPEFAWQRNYYERILRDESEFWRVREYINANPTNWDSDSDNPASTV